LSHKPLWQRRDSLSDWALGAMGLLSWTVLPQSSSASHHRSLRVLELQPIRRSARSGSASLAGSRRYPPLRAEDDIGLRVLLVDARRAGSSVGCWQALPCAPRSALAAGPGAFRRKPKVNAAPASHALLGAGSVAGYAPLAFSSKGSRHKASNRWGVQPIAYLRQH